MKRTATIQKTEIERFQSKYFKNANVLSSLSQRQRGYKIMFLSIPGEVSLNRQITRSIASKKILLWIKVMAYNNPVEK
ncbi:hypothetical protein [uncultured Desulfobacter sp.]|uniref:hypothetical protein n=1 Tax=uncultured Desulfobacter sp. TaxID=240139 RepID=UPI00374A2EA2